MPGQGVAVYESGLWEIDLARRELRSGGTPVPLGGRAFEIVEALIRSAGEVVTKTDLMSRIWPGAIVGENTLHVHVAAVRKALGADRSMLQTTSGRGYRLVGEWRPRPDSAAPITAVPAQPQVRSLRTNLPTVSGDLFGRDAAVTHVRDLVSAHRIVTLTGPAGIGKTRLALEVAHVVSPEFDGDVAMVELAPLTDASLVIGTIAAALGLQLSGKNPLPDVLARAIGDRTLLLVIDNCEHVIDVAASVIEVVLNICPAVSVIATSREVLRIRGECVYRVLPLDVPAEVESRPDVVLKYGAVELFIARANAANSTRTPRPGAFPSIAAICRHLDGIPLAIEFAAARAAVLGVEQVSIGLGDRFALLTQGRRTSLPRHRTLRAALDWSYELLPEQEQRLLCRLAVFSGGFTLDASTAVMHGVSEHAQSVVDGMAELVAKSLVMLDGSEDGGRWCLLETVQIYVLQKLVETGDIDGARRQHATYFRDLLASGLEGTSRRSRQDLMRFAAEINNVRAALDWSFSPTGDIELGVDITAAFAPVWLHLSLISECRERCEHALHNLGSEEASSIIRRRMRLKTAFGSALYGVVGPSEEVRKVLEEALELANEAQEPDTQILILAQLSAVHVYQGDYAKGRFAVEQLRQIAHEVGEPAVIGVADRRMGNTLIGLGRLHEAQECFESALRSLAAAEARPTRFWYHSDYRHLARAMLARALWLRGLADRARVEAAASIAGLSDTYYQLVVCRVLSFGMCRVATMTGDFGAAEAAIDRMAEVATKVGAPFWRNAALLLRGKLLVERGHFSDALRPLREAFETSRRMGWRFSDPEFKGALTEAFAGRGEIKEALDVIEDALTDASQQDGQAWYLPELLRIKGDVVLRHSLDRTDLAEDCYERAATMAREQGALTWELRIALSLARLRVTQGRKREARVVLSPVHDRFTEGFATTDLRAARALLDGLPGRPDDGHFTPDDSRRSRSSNL